MSKKKIHGGDTCHRHVWIIAGGYRIRRESTIWIKNSAAARGVGIDRKRDGEHPSKPKPICRHGPSISIGWENECKACTDLGGNPFEVHSVLQLKDARAVSTNSMLMCPFVPELTTRLLRICIFPGFLVVGEAWILKKITIQGGNDAISGGHVMVGAWAVIGSTPLHSVRNLNILWCAIQSNPKLWVGHLYPHTKNSQI
jgi:hypothetical protein